MTDQVTPAPDAAPAPAVVVEEASKKRKFVPSLPTVKKYGKIALMTIGAVAVAKKAHELTNKEVSVDFNAEVRDVEDDDSTD